MTERRGDATRRLPGEGALRVPEIVEPGSIVAMHVGDGTREDAGGALDPIRRAHGDDPHRFAAPPC